MDIPNPLEALADFAKRGGSFHVETFEGHKSIVLSQTVGDQKRGITIGFTDAEPAHSIALKLADAVMSLAKGE